MNPIFLFFNALGVFLGLFLFFFHRGYKTANRFLAVFILLSSFVHFFRFVVLYTDWVFLTALLLSVSHSLLFLIGPAAFFYVRSILRDNSKLTMPDYLHFLMFAIALAGSIPFLFGSFDEKLTAARELLHIGLNIRKIGVRYNVFYPNSTIVTLRILHFLFYVVAIWKLMWSNKIRFYDSKTAFGQLDVMKNWLLIFCITFSFFTFSSVVLVSLGFSTVNKEAFIQNGSVFIFFSSLCYVILNVSLFFFPKILYGFPLINPSNVKFFQGQQTTFSERKNGLEEVLGESQANQVLSNLAPLFENEYVDEIKNALTVFVSDKKYLLPTCSIGYVAEELNIPPHHLSYYFNNIELISFSDWRNKLRIQHASKLVQEGVLQSITFQALGEQCGFSTNNTFIRAFKNHTGQSPSAFAKTLGNSED